MPKRNSKQSALMKDIRFVDDMARRFPVNRPKLVVRSVTQAIGDLRRRHVQRAQAQGPSKPLLQRQVLPSGQVRLILPRRSG